jgi:hypothetical protein
MNQDLLGGVNLRAVDKTFPGRDCAQRKRSRFAKGEIPWFSGK